MVQINFGQREVSCKLVYYGPGMSGKTTNLEVIHQKAPDSAKGEMVSIATETDRTLYFDFLPLDLGQVAGMHTKFQLYTVPGQIYYNATRKLVLQGVDGVIFVADSAPDKMNENLESLQNLRDNLAEMGLQLDDLSLVLQYNKRDLPHAMSVEQINEVLNPMGVPYFEAVAKDGKGVFPTLKELSKIVIDKLNKEHAPAAQRRRTAGNLQASPPAGEAQPGVAATPPPQAAPSRMAAPPPTATPAAQTPPPTVRPQALTPLSQADSAPQAVTSAVPPQQPVSATAATPVSGNLMIPDQHEMTAKERHLNKAKPPSLDDRNGNSNNVNLGPTDPNLKKYKNSSIKTGGGAVRALLLVLLTLIICIIIVAIAFFFIQPVRNAIIGFMPPGLQTSMQEMFEGPQGNSEGSDQGGGANE